MKMKKSRLSLAVSLLLLSGIGISSANQFDNDIPTDFGDSPPKLFHEYTISKWKSVNDYGISTFNMHMCKMGLVYQVDNYKRASKDLTLVYNVFSGKPLICAGYHKYISLLKENDL